MERPEGPSALEALCARALAQLKVERRILELEEERSVLAQGIALLDDLKLAMGWTSTVAPVVSAPAPTLTFTTSHAELDSGSSHKFGGGTPPPSCSEGLNALAEITQPIPQEPPMPSAQRRFNERVEAWARAQDVDELSQRTYADHVVKFPARFAKLGFPGVYSASDVTREAILAFKYEGVSALRKPGKPLAITTRSMDLGLLQNFLAWEGAHLKRHGRRVLELALDGRLFRFRRGQVRSIGGRRMSREEVAAVLQHAPSDEARAVFALGVYGGLRPSEARAVVVEDLLLPFDRKPSVNVRKGKWDKPREVTLPRHARNLILAATVGKEPTERVYPWQSSKHSRDLDRACSAAGVRHIALHDLRRTYAALMFEAGAPLEAVQDQMGHEDPKTTRLYQGPVRVARAVDLLETFLGA